MIIDKLENLGKYVSLNPLFADVVDFLKDHDLNSMEVGKYPIKEKDLFLNLTTAKGRGKEAAVLETHIEMIDIQIPLEKDITLYGDLKAQTYLTLKPGQMAIFFPQDGHAPCISDNAEIKKAIFKVKVK